MKPAVSLIGPAASVLEAARNLTRARDRVAVLLDGDPGTGKTTLLDQLARELTGSPFAIEHVNGQSLLIELVRSWRERAGIGNLFSAWTVKRIDELDLASLSATNELLTYLDYLPPHVAVLATTNDYARLRAQSKGRLETRFVRFHVGAPSLDETTRLLVTRYKVPRAVARDIARGAVPDGCLESQGCNVRAAVKDAEGYLAARSVKGGRRG